MLEGSPVETKPKYIPHIKRVRDFALETAELRSLSPITADGLRKFSVSRFRVSRLEEIIGTRTRVSLEISEDPKARRLRMKPEEIPQHLKAAKITAFNIWDEYISGNPEAECAANEVIIFINNLQDTRKHK